MTFSPEDVRTNYEYFVHKLKAEKQRTDVLKAVDADRFDFILLDARGREAFAKGHIPGAWCVSESDVAQALEALPREKELVTYCWGHD